MLPASRTDLMSKRVSCSERQTFANSCPAPGCRLCALRLRPAVVSLAAHFLPNGNFPAAILRTRTAMSHLLKRRPEEDRSLS